MGLLVLGALGRACFADLGAQGADFLGVQATAGHEASRQTANCSAVDVVADAGCHRGDMLFVEAGRGAMVAGVGASVAGVDAIFVFQGFV